MKLWIDDVRPAPEGYIHCYSVIQARNFIQFIENRNAYVAIHTTEGITDEMEIELIDLDHDAGDFANQGGDYIKLLDWFEETGRSYPIHIHSQNVVGRMNMEAICRRNGWTIVD